MNAAPEPSAMRIALSAARRWVVKVGSALPGYAGDEDLIHRANLVVADFHD